MLGSIEIIKAFYLRNVIIVWSNNPTIMNRKYVLSVKCSVSDVRNT